MSKSSTTKSNTYTPCTRLYGNKVKQEPLSNVAFQTIADTFAVKVVNFYSSPDRSNLGLQVEVFKTRNIIRYSIIDNDGRMQSYDARLFLSQVLDKLIYDHMDGVHNWNTVIEFIFNQIYHRLPTNITQYMRKDGTYTYRLQCCKAYNSSRHVGCYKTLMEAIIEREKMINSLNNSYDELFISNTLLC